MGSLFAGLIFGGIATLIICGFLNTLVLPFRRKKALAEAKTVTANLADIRYPVGEDSCDAVTGIFEYEVDGRTYKYKCDYCTYPPETETLYYTKNPAHAKTKEHFGVIRNIIPFFLVTFLIGFVFDLIF